MKGPCLCGALDCRSCHPENFALVGDDWYYLDDDLMEKIPQVEEPEDDDE
jgi:hypothetical protein